MIKSKDRKRDTIETHSTEPQNHRPHKKVGEIEFYKIKSFCPQHIIHKIEKQALA